jgi:Flp pilus assembly CpaE family ATPase
MSDVDDITGIQRPMRVMVAAGQEELKTDLEAFLDRRETRLVGSVTRPRECLERLDDWEPDVLLVEEGMGGIKAVDLTRSVKQKRPKVAIFVMVAGHEYDDPDYHRRLMATNASGVFRLAEPLGFQEWIQPMRDAVELLDKIPETRSKELGRVLALHSLKGGVGRTLVASNLSVALSRHELPAGQDERYVLLWDLNWPFGGVNTFLNLSPGRSTLELLPVMNSLNRQYIMNATVAYLHPSLRILVSPLEQEQGEYLRDVIEEEIFYAEYDGISDDLMTQLQSANVRLGPDSGDTFRRELVEHVVRRARAKQAVVQLVRRLLTSAPRYFDFVVVDLPPVIDEVTLSVLRGADNVLLLCTPDVPAIRALRAELETLPHFGITAERIRLVLNRVRRSAEIRPEEVKILFDNQRWLAELPEDPKLEPLINPSTLAVEAARDSPFADGVLALTRAILADRSGRASWD